MKKHYVGLLLVVVLLLCTPVMASTTFKDVTINPDRTGLELTYTTDAEHTLIIWHVSEVQDSESLLTQTFKQSDLEKQSETTDYYLLQYLLAGGRFYVKIESSESAITISVYTNNYGMRYADSTLQLFYAIDGVGTTLNLDQTAITSYQGSITIAKTQTTTGGIQLQFNAAMLFALGWWLFVAVWFVIGLLLALWVYKDAQRRTCGREGLLWLIIVLVAGIIGLIIYLIVRKDLRCRR